MAEWLPISQIDALRSVLDNGPQPTMTPFADHAPARVRATAARAGSPCPAHDERRRRGTSSQANRCAPNRSKQPQLDEPGAEASTDLFGAPAQDDVLTSASANPAMHAPSAAVKTS